MNDTTATLRALHQVAVHIVARSRMAATGRFSLRIAPGGFATPDLADGTRRVRVAGDLLVVESDQPGDARSEVIGLHGATLRFLAEAAGVDLTTELHVGHDTPALGDADAALEVDRSEALAIGRWFTTAATDLDRLVGQRSFLSSPTPPRLWPEHFDVAVEAVVGAERRVNLGASPGDGFCAEPYLYVGPWGNERPGSPGFWNAPFGAIRRASDLDPTDPDAAVDFWSEGVERLEAP